MEPTEYPHRLPGSSRSSAAQLVAREAFAAQFNELLAGQTRVRIDPESDGSLVRSMARCGQITIRRL